MGMGAKQGTGKRRRLVGVWLMGWQRKIAVRPILKWAGGKTQLLSELVQHVPRWYGTYVEPFFGGGALFFSLQPEKAIVSDSNPELINLYRQIAQNVDRVIDHLRRYRNTEEDFYAARALRWSDLPEDEAAARMIYLNRTCFNGLYRVNAKGEFNVPYGAYINPKICDEENLRAASAVLRRADIVCADFASILADRVVPGDFVFLDPPYLPIGKWGDFKRYTKEQFHEEDHRRLALALGQLQRRGVWSVLTNSNHPLVRELFGGFEIQVVQTKRNISSRANSRKGEDVIVDAIPAKKTQQSLYSDMAIPQQVKAYPRTRYMGSKRKLLGEIYGIARQLEFESALDLFSGSGVVGYLFKTMGKRVICNDYMAMSGMFTKAMIENSSTTLSDEEAEALLIPGESVDTFVSTTFKGLFFPDSENCVIDVLRTNIARIRDPYKRAIAMSALIRACAKKRPRGLFTYIGTRYDDGRRDLRLSMGEQFLQCVKDVNNAVFDNGKDNVSRLGDAISLEAGNVDLVYMDPPYYTPKSDNEYVRRYHFLEGLARDWKGVEIQQETKTKKFRSYPTPFSSREGAQKAFESLFSRFRESTLLVSYSSNSLPTKDQMMATMRRFKRNVDVVPVDYRYNFGNRSEGATVRQNVQEYLFIGY